MKRILIICMVCLLLILGCATTKRIKQLKTQSKPIMLIKNLDDFNHYYEKFMENLNLIKDQSDKERTIIKTKYNFSDTRYTWEFTPTKSFKTESIYNAISPAISPDGMFLVGWQQTVEKIQNEEMINYTIIAQYIPSNAKQQIFQTTKSQFLSDISLYYPALSWSPFSNIFAFSAQDKKNDNNVFICVISYDENEKEIKYLIFQLTNNKDADVHYYDISWSSKGDKVAFTKNCSDDTFIQIYDFEDSEFEDIGVGSKSSCFRFGKKDKKKCFLIAEESGKYYPYFIENIKKPEKRQKLGSKGYSRPLFFASFADFSSRLTFLNINDLDNCDLSFYNYKKKNYYSFELADINYCDLRGYYRPNMNPIWLYDDNFIIFHANSKDRSQDDDSKSYYCFVAENSLEELKNEGKTIKINDFKSDRYFNSLTNSMYKFYYSSFEKSNYCIKSFYIKELKHKKKVKSVHEAGYYTKVLKYDSIKNEATLKRDNKPLNRESYNDSDIAGELREVKDKIICTIKNNSKIKFKKNAKLLIKWPKNIKSKKVSVTFEESTGKTQQTGIKK